MESERNQIALSEDQSNFLEGKCKKVLVSLSPKQSEILSKLDLFGTSNSERLRNIFVSFIVASKLILDEDREALEKVWEV